jgi:hypothetical protein
VKIHFEDKHLALEDVLKQLLNDKIKINSRYSLRRMALWLDISPSELSAILRKTRSVNAKLIDRLAPQLKLTSDEVKMYKLQAILSQATRSIEELNATIKVDDLCTYIRMHCELKVSNKNK